MGDGHGMLTNIRRIQDAMVTIRLRYSHGGGNKIERSTVRNWLFNTLNLSLLTTSVHTIGVEFLKRLVFTLVFGCRKDYC